MTIKYKHTVETVFSNYFSVHRFVVVTISFHRFILTQFSCQEMVRKPVSRVYHIYNTNYILIPLVAIGCEVKVFNNGVLKK